ncbi:MAG: acyl-CoA thioesterase [Blautia sp.]|nr:acyl-CoA thioesterase [Blautia sp.]
MKKYKHTVHYYETDRMGIVHHSNYIRWMEEARIDFLNQIGWGYEKLEACGIVSPVTSVECKYTRSTTFADEVYIEVFVEEFRGVRLKLRYVMTKNDGTIVCEARSEHCFLDTEGKIVRLERKYPEFYQLLCDLQRV